MSEQPVISTSNRRKFRTIDSTHMSLTYEKVIQIKDKIEEIAKAKQINIPALPLSAVPTDILFDIVSCYIALYDKLQEEELIVAGYPKPNNTTH